MSIVDRGIPDLSLSPHWTAARSRWPTTAAGLGRMTLNALAQAVAPTSVSVSETQR